MASQVNSHLKGVDYDDPRFRIHPTQQIVAACSGALCTSMFMTPLDVVKTRLQAQQRLLLSNKCFLYCNGLMDHLCPCGPNGSVALNKVQKFNGTFDAFLKISRSEGVKSLWSGLGPTLILALPTTVIYFVAYEQIRVRCKDYYLKWKPNSDHKIPWWIPLFSGSAARVLAVSIVSPLELVRTKMQSQKLSYLEVGRGLKLMVNQQGVLGLWKGLWPTLLRDVPFSGIYWTSYETIKSAFDVTTPTTTFSFFGGAAAGSIAAVCTTPFDVVKTHKQIEFGENVIYTDKPNPVSDKVLPTMKKIYQLNGLKGLYAGVLPRLLKVAPACAIMIASFEYGKAFFYNYNVNKSQQSEFLE